MFYSPTNPEIPMRTETLLRALKNQLTRIGFPKELAKTITIHAWRHYHDTYLNGKISPRILQNQSGHSIEMIETLYANHEKPTDQIELFNAQEQIFGPVLEPSIRNMFKSIQNSL